MAFGNLGQLIAGTAIEATKKNVIDAITGPDPTKTQAPAATTPPSPQNETIGGMILGQVQAMQRPLRDDQELVVQFHTGGEMLRVVEIFVPTLQVLVLSGMDAEQNVTRVVVAAEHLQLVCKIKKVAPDAQPVRVVVRSPRPKGD